MCMLIINFVEIKEKEEEIWRGMKEGEREGGGGTEKDRRGGRGGGGESR